MPKNAPESSFEHIWMDFSLFSAVHCETRFSSHSRVSWQSNLGGLWWMQTLIWWYEKYDVIMQPESLLEPPRKKKQKNRNFAEKIVRERIFVISVTFLRWIIPWLFLFRFSLSSTIHPWPGLLVCIYFATSWEPPNLVPAGSLGWASHHFFCVRKAAPKKARAREKEVENLLHDLPRTGNSSRLPCRAPKASANLVPRTSSLPENWLGNFVSDTELSTCFSLDRMPAKRHWFKSAYLLVTFTV